MKVFRESLIILGIYLMGEFISKISNIPVPGNIIGMIILFILLYTKVVKIENIANISKFLLDHLAFFFVPAGVGLMTSMDIIKSTWIQILMVCIITTVVIMGATGLMVQYVSRKIENKAKISSSLNVKTKLKKVN